MIEPGSDLYRESKGENFDELILEMAICSYGSVNCFVQSLKMSLL
jgi:hypothetical protein